MTHPRTPERDETVRTMWKAGEPANKIAKALGMGKSAFYDLRHALNLPDRPKPNPFAWLPEEYEMLRERWDRGDSAAVISRAMPNRSRDAILGMVHRLGLVHGDRDAVLKPSRPLRAPSVKRAPSTGSGHSFSKGKTLAARIADKQSPPKPGSQKKTPVAFGNMPATTHAEAEVKREAAAVAGAQHIKSFHFPANDDAILLVDRRFGQCSWPVGEPVRPADQLCCGQPVIGERTKSTATYCDQHRLRASPTGVPSVRGLARTFRRAA